MHGGEKEQHVWLLVSHHDSSDIKRHTTGHDVRGDTIRKEINTQVLIGGARTANGRVNPVYAPRYHFNRERRISAVIANVVAVLAGRGVGLVRERRTNKTSRFVLWLGLP